MSIKDKNIIGEKTMDLSRAQLLEIAQFSIIHMDGAWFWALARELGVETAWKMDVEAWKQFSYVFGKDANVTIKHTKNLNRGDECCEVVVSM
jgi:hypothetical protein